MIKAIETHYKGYRFRSRLEARWAVFFDALEIEWQYEPEGYNINGVMYLPDFYLPQYQMFCEVKPAGLSEKEIDKVNILAMESGHPCLMLIGAPNPEGETYIAAWNYKGQLEYAKHQFAECTDCLMYNNYDEPGFTGLTNTEVWRQHILESESACHDYACCDDTLTISNAAIKARSARFEHGERVTA